MFKNTKLPIEIGERLPSPFFYQLFFWCTEGGRKFSFDSFCGCLVRRLEGFLTTTEKIETVACKPFKVWFLAVFMFIYHGYLRRLGNFTGCSLIAETCFSVHKIIFFWALRSEILDFETSLIYILISNIFQLKIHFWTFVFEGGNC